MLFKGNSSRLELLIGKIHAHKEPSQDEQHKSKGLNVTFFSISFLPLVDYLFSVFRLRLIFHLPRALYFSTKFSSTVVLSSYFVPRLFIPSFLATFEFYWIYANNFILDEFAESNLLKEKKM